MGDPLTVRSSNPALNWGTAIGVVCLAAGGFTLSFSALRDLAIKSGIDTELAFLWPLIVDGFIVVATAAAFALKRRGRRVTWYPWTALIFFSAISVIGNSIHATDARDLRVPVPVATIVSSVPALALLVASHLLVVMIEGRAGHTAREAHRKQQDRSLSSVSIPTTNGEPAHESLGHDGATPGSDRPQEAGVFDESIVERLRVHARAGRPITGAVVADELGVSERTGRRRLEQFRVEFPDMFGTEPVR